MPDMARANLEDDPLFLFLKVPYICSYNASHTCVHFRDVPARHGICLENPSDPRNTAFKPEEVAALLQEWLFFAALNSISRVFDVDFNPLDFVSEDSENRPCVTGSQFHQYVCFWVGGIEPGLYASTVGRLNEQRNEVVYILKVVEKTTQAWTELENIVDSTSLDIVLLSISQLADHLRKVLRSLLASPSINSKSVGLLQLYPRYGHQLLLKAGWCIGELPALVSRYSPSALLYLSTLDRIRNLKDHQRCRPDACVANQLDSKNYKTAHTTNCQDSGPCEMIYAPVEQICTILEAGDIPLMSLSKGNHPDIPSLEVTAFPLSGKQQDVDADNRYRYVAISHVWSDGMGNPGRNALHACQLRRIQRAVNGLDLTETDPATRNRPFWLDTLCVPLNPSFRSLAIIRMARTYLHAKKVLVFDNWLMQDAISRSSPRRILCRLVHADWNTRVWTFQEAVLARECYIQLADGAVTIEQLVGVIGDVPGVEVVSKVLSDMDEDKLLNNKCALNLLRALIHIDPLAIERNHRVISTAAQLPLENASQEVDRLVAIQAEQDFKSRCSILEKWFPVLEKAGCISEDTEADNYRLNSLIWPLKLEPVSSHIEVLAMLIRGFGFEFEMERSEDLKGEKSRKLKGLRSKPGLILPGMIFGIRGRTTSWKDDETICLGGMIGIDVSPITSIRVPTEEREEKEQWICEERMKAFLSSVGAFPESILFCTSKRLTKYPWRWAPASFLDNNESSFLAESYHAECTGEGLLVNCPGVTILPNQSIISLECNTIRLRFKIPFSPRYKAIRPDDVFDETLIEIRTTSGAGREDSWYDVFAKYDKDLVLLKTSNRNEVNRDAILGRYMGTKNGIRLVSYIANVARVHRAFQDSDQCVVGTMEDRTTKWCVG